MRIRIKTLPPGDEAAEYDIRFFQVGQVYDVGPRLADLLIVGGYAIPEMRATDRADDKGMARQKSR